MLRERNVPVEGNVKINTQMLHEWNPPARRSLDVDRTETHVQLDSSGDEHFYVSFKRVDRSFSIPPVESSLAFQPGQALNISVDAVASNSLSVSYFIIEYTVSGKSTHSYSSPSFVHVVSKEAQLITLAVRAKGRGRLVLGAVSSKPYQVATGWVSFRDIRPGQKVSLRINAFAIGTVSSAPALVAATFRDPAGNVVLPMDESPVNPRIGAYKYVLYGSFEHPAETVFDLEAPPGATAVHFNIVPWKKGEIYLVEDPVIVTNELAASEITESIAAFIDSIPIDDTLVVLYTTAPQLGHPTLALRPNRLTEEYLGRGHWVVFFPFSRVPFGEEKYAEKARQYSREHINEFLAAASSRRGKSNIFICSSFPDIVAVGAVDFLSMHGWSTVYEVRDDMEEFNRVGYSKWFHPMLETRVASQVDTVVAVSPRLADKMDILRKAPGKSRVVPNGVNAAFIEQTKGNRTESSYRRRSESMTVGYIGHLTSSWFDWPLLISSAEEMPDVSFEIIGHGFPDGLKLPKNVRYLGAKTHAEFREIAKGWKAGIIPFKPSTLTFAVDPNKIYEYLAVGLRTVTARMGSVHLCPSTWIYDCDEDFSASIALALKEPYSVEEIDAIEEYLGTVSWGQRAETMMSIIKGDND